MQGQVTTLQMPFTCKRKCTDFSSTLVRICVKDAIPLVMWVDGMPVDDEYISRNSLI